MHIENIKISRQGLIALLLVAAGFVIALVKEGKIHWLYFMTAITLYLVAVIVRNQEDEAGNLTDIRIIAGIHLSYFFSLIWLIIGLKPEDVIISKVPLLDSGSSAYLFPLVASIAAGFGLPYLMLKVIAKSTKKNPLIRD